MNRKFCLLILCLSLLLSMSIPGATAGQAPVRVAALKGPTGMGIAWLMAQNELGQTENGYTFTLAGAPDQITGQLVTGELDIAALPTNAIALLSSRTDGAIQSLAINTLGVLYLLQRSNAVHTPEDVADMRIVSAGQGSTVEVVARRLFPDAAIEYVSEHAEAVARAVSGEFDLVLLPEPFVTSLLTQDNAFSIAVDLTAAWEASTGALLPMGGIAVRRAFAEENPQAVEAFLKEYAQSVSYANELPEQAALLIEQYDIMRADIAAQAIPRANIVLVTGGEMRQALVSFYEAIMEIDAALIGGSMPDDAFYYAAP